MRLTSDGLDFLDLDTWDSGISCESFQVGPAQVRAVTTDRPNANGTFDETRHFGARSVTLGLKVYAGDEYNRRQLMDRIGAYMDPGRRSVLEWTDPTGGGPRRMVLRAAEPAIGALTDPHVADIGAQFVCPSGLIESASESYTWIAPVGSVPGFTFDISFPLTFPSFVGGGPTTVINFGSVPAEWRVALFGPLTGPTLTNLNSEQSISFPGLNIGAADYVLIDSADRTVLYNGEPGASRYDFFDFTGSTWWQLGVGASLLELTADSAVIPAAALFAHRNAYIL